MSTLRRVCAVGLGAALNLSCGDSTAVVQNPAPGIFSVAPFEVNAGAIGQFLTITGSDFMATSVVRIDGSDRPMQFESATQILVALSSADVATSGTRQVVVVNPPPGGGPSNVATFVVLTQETPGPTPNPVPVVNAIDPSFATTGSGATTITITGTGFMAASTVQANSTQLTPVTYVSATQLQATVSAEQMAAGGALTIRVTNPFPGGGTSNATTFEVRSPVPALTELATTQATAGLPELTLRVTGTGFITSSKVSFSGAERPTTYVNATTLDVLLGEGDLRVAGTFPITVVNPSPGGGTSNALDFVLVNGVPNITLLPSTGGHAGRPGFTLTVHGSGFVQGAEVHWNGAARPSQYVSGTRMTVEISTADMAAPGTASITVVNPGPGGGTSAPAAFTIRDVPATTASASTSYKLHARDLAWDAATARLYLSVAASAPLDANSVIAVNPVNGEVTGRVFVGSDPARMDRTADGQYLYVGLNGANAVRRVAIASLTAGLQWSVGAGLVAGEIKVLPGSATTVAISRHSPGTSPPLVGVTIYDDGVARPESSPGHTGGNRIEFLDSPNVLYGFNNSHTGFEFFTIGIDATGARHLFATGGLISGFYTHITGAAGRIYGTDGSIVDAERRVKAGSLPVSSALLVDAVTGRAFALQDGGIAVYDINNFQLIGTVPVASVVLGHPALIWPRLVRWGSDGIAFLDEDDLFVVRSPAFSP